VPEVSAVIPTRDRKPLLLQALASVRAQKSVDLEVVVVDDGSCDGTADRVAALGDPRVRVIRHDRPLGQACARNTGVAAATGEWVAFLDDDDLWHPSKLVEQLRALRRTGREWCYVGVIDVDADLRLVRGRTPLPPEVVSERLPRWNEVPGGGSGVAIRRVVVAELGGFDPALRGIEDWDLYLRVARRGPPAWAPQPLLAYRLHSGNVSLRPEVMLPAFHALRAKHGDAVHLDMPAFLRELGSGALRSGRPLAAARRYVAAIAAGDRRSRVLLPTVALPSVVREALRLRGADRTWTAEAEAWLRTFRASVATTGG